MQLCLSYFVMRFSPIVRQTLISINTIDSMIQVLIRTVDVTFTSTLVLCTLSFQQVAYDQWVQWNKKAIAVAISIGTFGILLLSTYPLHISIGGNEWWQCINDTYPRQDVGMIGYIYVPATVTFSLILFSATLYQRGILSRLGFE